MRWAHTILLGVTAAACNVGPPEDLIFLDGRGVAAVGDSLVAVTRQDSNGVVVVDRRSGAVYWRAVNALESPHHVQQSGDAWYVSNVRNGEAEIVVFDLDWQLTDRISLAEVSATPHQFAVLPDGRVVVEAADGRLAALGPDSLTTFALTEQSSRTGLVVAALGGVLHAVPDRTVTLYNGLGRVRWRLEWPWQPTAYPTDLAVDPRGRIHLMAGEGVGQPSFVAFTFSAVTGEVIRWSMPGGIATFSVNRVGDIDADDPARWLGGR
jgi:hypothetical protein